MNNKLLTSLFVVSSFLLLTGFGGGCGHTSPEKRAKRAQKMALSHVEDVLDEVDASDAQKQRILLHTTNVTKEGLALHAKHQGTKKFLYEQWQADKPNAPAIHTMIDERTEGVRLFLHKLADALIDTHQTLTPDQREEIVEELH